jgi:sodium-independent sulfate anion transporter 11
MHVARIIFFPTVLRSVIVLIITTIAAWLFCRDRVGPDGKYPIAILRHIPPGLQAIGIPRLDSELFGAMAAKLPVATIIVLLEPIATGKST